METIYDRDLARNPANHQPLTPLGFLERAATVFPERTAIVHGALRRSYAEFYTRSRRLASALAKRGIGRGDTVAAMLSNTPAMLEAHYGVPMTGAVLNTLNTRLDAAIIAFSLKHGEAKVLITAGPTREPIDPVRHAGLETDDWLDLFARRLQNTMDRLAEDAIARDPEKFDTILQGAVGIGGIYDLWRRARAAARGERFTAEHGRNQR